MTRAFLTLISLWIIAISAPAQVPDDPNEGSRVTYDSATQTYTLSWWGQYGVSYFVQHSEDLVTWSYYPVIVDGIYDIAELNFQTNASRYFVRLEPSYAPWYTDSDGDGIPDAWEVLHGLNPHFNDAAADPDSDGLSNYWEYKLGLDPLVADTGNTGVPDGQKDNDGDGLTNVAEINIHQTDPTQYDTDGDGLNDGWELRYGFDPLVDNTFHDDPDMRPDGDPDLDGLPNLEEEQLDTNPFNADTDGDGASDYLENQSASNPSNAASTPTNPGGVAGGPTSPLAPVVPVTVYFGDPSGSHSEKYRVILEPLEGDPNTQTRYRTNQKYGEVLTDTFYLPKGAKYKVTLKHIGTDPGAGLSSPDCDYTLDFDPSTGSADAAAVTDDPAGILGGHYESDPFFAAGKNALLYVAWLTSETTATLPTNRQRTKLGVGESVALILKPAMPAFSWQLSGTVGTSQVDLPSASTNILTAGERACAPVVEASYSGFTVSIGFTVVEPDGAVIEQFPGSGIWHVQGTPSAGFYGAPYISPFDVSFKAIQVREGGGVSIGTGYYFPDSGRQHDVGRWDNVIEGTAARPSKWDVFDTIEVARIRQGKLHPGLSTGQFHGSFA